MKPMQEVSLVWIGSSKRDLMNLPVSVRKFFGHALGIAQDGGRHVATKTLKHFGSADVLELSVDDRDGTYRTVYSVRFSKAVFVLHVFQKKSRYGASTDKADIDLILKRLKVAEKLAQEMRDE